MDLVILLIIFVFLAAIIVWVADWTSGGRRYTALAILNRRASLPGRSTGPNTKRNAS
jgi:hypothetical protein